MRVDASAYRRVSPSRYLPAIGKDAVRIRSIAYAQLSRFAQPSTTVGRIVIFVAPYCITGQQLTA